jgi:hypothetical protein
MCCFHYCTPFNQNKGEEKKIQALLDEKSLSKQKPIDCDELLLITDTQRTTKIIINKL